MSNNNQDDEPEITETETQTPAQQNEAEVDRQKRLEEDKRQRQEEVKKRREEQRKKSEVLKAKDETTSASQAPPTPVKKPIREDVVNSCVNFLNHPKVKGSATSQKVLFLQKKGLTQDEIDEALKRANGQSTTAPAAPSPTVPVAVAPAPAPGQAPYNPQQGPYPPPGYPPSPYGYPVQYMPPQQQVVPASSTFYGRYGFVLTAASCLTIGAGLAYLAKKYIFKDTEEENRKQAELIAKEKERKQKEEEERKANIKVLEEMVASIKSIQSQNNDLQETLKTFQNTMNDLKESSGKTKFVSSASGNLTGSANTVNSSTDNLSKIMMSEMQSQINALKAQIVDLKSSKESISTTKPVWSPTTVKPSIPSWQQVEDKPATSTTITTTTTTTTPVVTPETTTTPTMTRNEPSKEAAPYPKDFQSIMEMVQNGQTPPGIRTDINDKPLDPNHKIEKGNREAQAKPWSMNKPTQETTTTTSEPVEIETIEQK